MSARKDELIRCLEQLLASYGRCEFRRAVKELEQRRLEVSRRERRKRFAWSKHQMLYSMQKGVCPLCLELMPLLKGEVEIDHKDPNRTPGFNSDENLQLTHRRCNREKSSRSVYEQAKKGGQIVIDLVQVAK